MENNNIEYNKKGKKRTNIGKFLANVKNKVAPAVLDAIGVGDIAKAIGIISDSPNNAGLTKEEAHEFFKLAELELKDIANARNMYTDTDNDTANFIAKRVINYNLWVVILAVNIEILTVIYMDDKTLIAIVSSAVGAFTTALLQERQQIINFFFGSSLGSKKKTDTLNKFNK